MTPLRPTGRGSRTSHTTGRASRTSHTTGRGSRTLLAIDIGNSNICAAVFRGETLATVWRLTTRHSMTADELGLSIMQFLRHFKILPETIDQVAVSSVVPPLDQAVREMVETYLRVDPWWVGENLPCPLKIATDSPAEVGADLLTGAYAAYRLYGGPIIVVDFGTATTVTAVSRKGEFLGTAIAPGIAISADALFARASKLPRIPILPPPKAIGTNTVHSMQSGFFYGFVGQVEKIIRKFREELGVPIRTVATGGLAEVIAKETESITILNPNLVLEGIRLMVEAAGAGSDTPKKERRRASARRNG